MISPYQGKYELNPGYRAFTGMGSLMAHLPMELHLSFR